MLILSLKIPFEDQENDMNYEDDGDEDRDEKPQVRDTYDVHNCLLT